MDRVDSAEYSLVSKLYDNDIVSIIVNSSSNSSRSLQLLGRSFSYFSEVNDAVFSLMETADPWDGLANALGLKRDISSPRLAFPFKYSNSCGPMPIAREELKGGYPRLRWKKGL
ncbi:Uncharacterized protein Fot_08535 [Forsythia ovata]|uniref:Uncharacterized protein n=1 Tax=Forsythia ovata TaxID=205694 RepID=A0ABD1WZB9_9LAMI